ncbi:hypothetical protein [Ensifer sp.]|uniref:hypothetical protein n=1 Tax=Ensifer sp. TaxID=1872086 RepID=UPI00289F5213|nr:hypothetical protein [Ensifer sp.]
MAEDHRLRGGFKPVPYKPLPSERRRQHERDWLDGLERDRRGKPLTSLANTLWALREDWNLSGLIALEPGKGRAVLKARPPWADAFRDFEMRGFSHRDMIELHAYLERLMPGIKRSMVLEAVHIAAAENAMEPCYEQA